MSKLKSGDIPNDKIKTLIAKAEETCCDNYSEAIDYAEKLLKKTNGNLLALCHCHRMHVLKMTDLNSGDSNRISELGQKIEEATNHGADLTSGEHVVQGLARTFFASAWILACGSRAQQWPEAIATYDAGLRIWDSEYWRDERMLLQSNADQLNRIRLGDALALDEVVRSVVTSFADQRWNPLLETEEFIERMCSYTPPSDVLLPGSDSPYNKGVGWRGRAGKVAVVLSLSKTLSPHFIAEIFGWVQTLSNIDCLDVFRRFKAYPLTMYDGELPQFVHDAIYHERLEILTYALNKGLVSPNAKSSEGRPLIVTGAFQKRAIVQVLLDAGADVNSRDHHGRTPLHYASEIDVAKLLLARGADPSTVDNFGKSCLANARTFKHRDVIPLINAALKKFRRAPAPAPIDGGICVRDWRKAITTVGSPKLKKAVSAWSANDVLPLEELIELSLELGPDAHSELCQVLQHLNLSPRPYKPGAKLVVGDVSIAGDLESDGWFIALGSLNVDGVFSDQETDCTTIVSGPVTAKAIFTSGNMSLLDDATAELIFGDYNDGTLVIDGQMHTPLFLSNDHHCEVGGTGSVIHLDADEYSADDPSLIEHLVDDVMPGGEFSPGNALELLRQGKPILRRDSMSPPRSQAR